MFIWDMKYAMTADWGLLPGFVGFTDNVEAPGSYMTLVN